MYTMLLVLFNSIFTLGMLFAIFVIAGSIKDKIKNKSVSSLAAEEAIISVSIVLVYVFVWLLGNVLLLRLVHS
jgi:hypothetical protein